MSLSAEHGSKPPPSGLSRRRFVVGLVGCLLVAPLQAQSVAATLAAIFAKIPGSGAGVYQEPGEVELADFRTLYEAMARREIVAAGPLAEAVGYTLTAFDDPVTSRHLWLLQERSPWSRYRGACLIDPSPEAVDLVIESPHPKYDIHSWRLAAALFGSPDLRPFALVMTTAHRYDTGSKDEGPTPADVTHHTPSVFQVAHEALTTVGAHRSALQVHGFKETAAILEAFDAERVDCIVSQGWTADYQPLEWPDDAPAVKLIEGLRSRGVQAVASKVKGQPLNAGQNPQGHFTNGPDGAGQGWFIHVEVASRLRFAGAEDPAAFAPIVETVVAMGWPGG